MSVAPEVVHRELRAKWERECGRPRGCARIVGAARLVLAWGSVTLLVVGSFDVDVWVLPVPALLTVAVAAIVLGVVGVLRRLRGRGESEWRDRLANAAWSDA